MSLCQTPAPEQRWISQTVGRIGVLLPIPLQFANEVSGILVATAAIRLSKSQSEPADSILHKTGNRLTSHMVAV